MANLIMPGSPEAEQKLRQLQADTQGQAQAPVSGQRQLVMPQGFQFGEGDRSASFGALVRGGFIDDPATKIRMFAEQRGISPERYRVIDGQIYYQGADGKFYAEIGRAHV